VTERQLIASLTADSRRIYSRNAQHSASSTSARRTWYPLAGALNLHGIEFARKGGGNCKERNVQGKAPQFASVWTCKEWIYLGNQEMELARNGGGICKELTLQWMRTMLCLSQFRRRQYLTRIVMCEPQGRRSLWDRGDTSPQYLDRGDMITNVPPIFLE